LRSSLLQKESVKGREMPKYNKGDWVKVKATLFDNWTRDRNGLLFSEKWAADRNGEWCFGVVAHVYVVKGRRVQTSRIKYDRF
jgi:hypothetical protein